MPTNSLLDDALAARGEGVPTEGPIPLEDAREVDVSLERAQTEEGEPVLGLTVQYESGPRSVTYLGTHGELFADEETLVHEILVTDVHETLHGALGYGVGAEDWIDELAYWSLEG